MGLMVLLLSVRIRAIARRKRIAGLVSRWRAIFTGTALARPPVAVARSDAFTVLNLWNDFHRVNVQAGGIADDVLDAAARANGFDRLALYLMGKNAGSRLVALTAIGYLRLPSALECVIGSTEDELGDISLAAYRAAVRIDSAHMGAFAQAILEHGEWRPRNVEQILRELGPQAITAWIARAAAGATDEQLPGLIRYFVLCEPSGIRPALEEILTRRPDAGVLAAALRALLAIVEVRDRPMILRLLRRSESFVRIAAIAALVPVVADEDRELLEDLMADEDSWVRYRAAQALISAFPQQGRNGELERESADRFARDALKQVLAERSVLAKHAPNVAPDGFTQERRAVGRLPMDELRA